MELAVGGLRQIIGVAGACIAICNLRLLFLLHVRQYWIYTMSMTPALIVLSIQGVLGAYDNFRNHEFREGLPLRSSQRGELALHAAREAAYCIIFPTIAWFEWHGWLAWLLVAIIVAEVGITCWDFVEEDRTRRLSRNERVLHTILTLTYGAFLAFLLPELISWSQQPAGIVVVDRGFWSWLMSVYSLGVLIFGIREASAAIRMWRQAETPAMITPHRASTYGFDVAPALGALHSEAKLRCARGTANVEIGAWPARVALRAIGLDMTAGSQSISVTFEPDGDGELWHRTFATGRFISRFERDPNDAHGLIEMYGPFTFRYRIFAENGRIDWQLRQVRLFEIPLPRVLAPQISATEWIDQQSQYQMKASVSVPLLGPALGRVDKRDSHCLRVLIQGCSLRSGHGTRRHFGRGMGDDRAASAIGAGEVGASCRG